MLIRFSYYLGEAEKNILIVASILTIILAGRSATLEVDIKKVVALSTLSQVGIIIFSIRVGAVEVAFFHLLVHAFFKALMFMCVGGVIFYRGGCQDARFLRGMCFRLPITRSLLVFSNMSLIGFPFLSGFYSKELIVGSYLCRDHRLVGVLLLLISLGFTFCYALRMLVLVLKNRKVSSLRHYSIENRFYVMALLLMRNGAISMAFLIQRKLEIFVRDTLPRGDIFYVGLGVIAICIFNFIILIIIRREAGLRGFIKGVLSFI